MHHSWAVLCPWREEDRNPHMSESPLSDSHRELRSETLALISVCWLPVSPSLLQRNSPKPDSDHSSLSSPYSKPPMALHGLRPPSPASLALQAPTDLPFLPPLTAHPSPHLRFSQTPLSLSPICASRNATSVTGPGQRGHLCSSPTPPYGGEGFPSPFLL